MSALDQFFAATAPAPHARLTIVAAPEGHDAFVVGGLVARGVVGSLLHVCADDGHLARTRAALAFFHPGLEVLALPAWDCLPYDRVSPNPDIISRRIDTLTRLAAGAAAGLVVLTTVNAAIQRVPPRKLFIDRVLRLAPGGAMPLDRLVSFLGRNGYQRTDTVREAGEFAIRGGLADLFPSGAAEPVRLDFFGDTLEGLRSFDPLSQRTTGTTAAVTLRPMSEVLLDDDSIRRFRSRYREQFGTVANDDPFYESVSAGRRYIGMEHWLPLYYESLETIFDYLPNAAVTLAHETDLVRRDRLEQIADFYAARQDVGRAARASAPVYRAVEPKQLFLEEAEWAATLGRRRVGAFERFAAPPTLTLPLKGGGNETNIPSPLEGGRPHAVDGVGGEPRAQHYDAGARPGHEFADARASQSINLFDAVRDYVRDERDRGQRVLIAAYSAGSADRLKSLLRDHGVINPTVIEHWADFASIALGDVALAVLAIEHGYGFEDAALVTEQDILGDRLARPARRRANYQDFVAEVASLNFGDLVVHDEHGIGRYDGLVTLDVAGAPHDCLRVVYAGDDKLFVPVENIEVLTRYGSEHAEAALDRLGSVAWQSRKSRVKQRIKDIANELIQVAAERQLREGEPMPAPEGMYEEFAARFPYPETEDQDRAIGDTIGDLASGRPMDRLICGDVGFGKTEVALRAAFIAVMTGTQVAIVVPTTLLARQHFRTIVDRFSGLPVRVEQLSRFVPAKRAAEVKRDLADGRVDIVVGTHALLAKGITFRHLGLLVIDEEQHFGVAQKERLKQLKANVHVLTLTATPIPRTLQQALSGVREMSVIATAPVDRLAVRTYVLPYDPVVVREAILREIHRGGQCFYVAPRISDLDDVKQQLDELVPEIKVVMAHGKMGAAELEHVMAAFDEHAFDVLLSTNIIESGLDIPSANTLIVHRADMFGLAQLYQLRGRIGRAKLRAYAYLTLPAGKMLTETPQRRLEVMQTLDQLGAGFTLASHDLDIRGAGNLLGAEQSGHIREVGVELYQHLLEEAIAAARSGVASGDAQETWTPQITIGTPVLIPDSYVADLNVRLGLYRRIAALLDRREIDGFAAELVDRFGKLPSEVDNLLEIIAIKRLCHDAGVEKIEAGPKGALIAFHKDSFANPLGLVRYIEENGASARLRPDQRLVIMRNWETPVERVKGINALLARLAEIAAAPPPPSIESLVKAVTRAGGQRPR